MIYAHAEALDRQFPGTREPFRILARILEEAGELAAQVHRAEGAGIKREKLGPPDGQDMAGEMLDVLTAIASLATHYGLREALADAIRKRYESDIARGLIAPGPY